MSNEKILYLYKQENVHSRLFAETLRNALKDRKIALANLGLSSLLFDLKKYDLIHVFLTTDETSSSIAKKLSGRPNVIQTILNPVEKPNTYKEIAFGTAITVFSEQEKEAVRTALPTATVEAIPFCFPAPLTAALQPASETRRKLDVGERFMVVAAGDLSTKAHFDAYIYAAREFQRLGVYRFLIVLNKKDKESQMWGDRLKYSVGIEKLQSTTILEDPADFLSLVDASDLILYLNKKPELQFEFLPSILPALLLGKAVFCYNVPPLNELILPAQKSWVCNSTEDFVRESRDLQKEAVKLEQISTELARMARERLKIEHISARYGALYNSVLSSMTAGKAR